MNSSGLVAQLKMDGRKNKNRKRLMSTIQWFISWVGIVFFLLLFSTNCARKSESQFAFPNAHEKVEFVPQIMYTT